MMTASMWCTFIAARRRHSALRGRVQAFFDAVGSSMAHIQAGSYVRLGTAAARFKVLPRTFR
jgi:hypothetical protein